MAQGMVWVSRVSSVSLEMVLPAAAGHWLDGRWDTAPWCVSAGAVLGFAMGMHHLLQLTGTNQPRKTEAKQKRRHP